MYVYSTAVISHLPWLQHRKKKEGTLRNKIRRGKVTPHTQYGAIFTFPWFERLRSKFQADYLARGYLIFCHFLDFPVGVLQQLRHLRANMLQLHSTSLWDYVTTYPSLSSGNIWNFCPEVWRMLGLYLWFVTKGTLTRDGSCRAGDMPGAFSCYLNIVLRFYTLLAV
jgi:hypothetical protein